MENTLDPPGDYQPGDCLGISHAAATAVADVPRHHDFKKQSGVHQRDGSIYIDTYTGNTSTTVSTIERVSAAGTSPTILWES